MRGTRIYDLYCGHVIYLHKQSVFIVLLIFPKYIFGLYRRPLRDCNWSMSKKCNIVCQQPRVPVWRLSTPPGLTERGGKIITVASLHGDLQHVFPSRVHLDESAFYIHVFLPRRGRLRSLCVCVCLCVRVCVCVCVCVGVGYVHWLGQVKQ